MHAFIQFFLASDRPILKSSTSMIAIPWSPRGSKPLMWGKENQSWVFLSFSLMHNLTSLMLDITSINNFHVKRDLYSSKSDWQGPLRGSSLFRSMKKCFISLLSRASGWSWPFLLSSCGTIQLRFLDTRFSDHWQKFCSSQCTDSLTFPDMNWVLSVWLPATVGTDLVTQGFFPVL